MFERTLVTSLGWLVLLAGTPALSSAAGEEQPKAAATGVEKSSFAAEKQALARFQAFVGEWKGVGQPRRGSSQGAWSELSDWAWAFTDGHAALVAHLSQNPYFSKLQLSPGDKADTYRLVAVPAGEKDGGKNEARFDGSLGGDGPLVLTVVGDPPPAGPARITIRIVAGGDRLVALYERRSGDQFARLAEVGNTRKGSSFAVKGGDPHECIVTGGHGTIAVEYKGQTYYVCCSGCRDLFKQDPEKVLAEWRERKAKESRQ